MAENYVKTLLEMGVVVIPCVHHSLLPDIRKEFNDTVEAFPEFLTTPPQYVLGGFSALGNPASFHNPFVRKIRQWVMHAAVGTLWRDYMKEEKVAGFKLEQCPDRMLLRPPGVSPSAESWHRDEAKSSLDSDQTFGGWINLDSKAQGFSCVPKTHKVKRNKGGFAPISKDDAKEQNLKELSKIIIIPPGHIIIFFEHIIHQVLASKSSYSIYRVFIGWRVTEDCNPLIPNSAEELTACLQEQRVLKLKSGQTPPMYAKLHWTNWRDKIVQFSLHLKPIFIVNRIVGSGGNKGTSYAVVTQEMMSLSQAHARDSSIKLYPKYTETEISMHIPARKWHNILVPGSNDSKESISL